MRSRTFTQDSDITAPADKVWSRVVTPEGINDEMAPWLTMGLPRGAESLTVDTVQIGAPLGKAWLRLFGLIPFDYDALTIAELEPGQRFLEKSTMLSMRRWEHERTLTPLTDDSTRVRDQITFEPRLLLVLATPLLARLLRAFFAHRHRRLQKHFA